MPRVVDNGSSLSEMPSIDLTCDKAMDLFLTDINTVKYWAPEWIETNMQRYSILILNLAAGARWHCKQTNYGVNISHGKLVHV